MALTVNLTVGRLLSRNEKLTTAKFNAVVKSVVINITGSVANSDLVAGAVTPDKLTMGAYFFAAATYDGSTTYTAAYSPVLTGYTDGLVLDFKANSANVGASLFDAGGGPLPLVKYGGTQPLDPGDIAANGNVTVRYNSTLVAGGCWEVLSVPARPPTVTPLQPASAYLAGHTGLVPSAKAGQQNLYLRGDATWQDPVAAAVAQTSAANWAYPVLQLQNFI